MFQNNDQKNYKNDRYENRVKGLPLDDEGSGRKYVENRQNQGDFHDGCFLF